MLLFGGIFHSQVNKQPYVFQVNQWWYERAEETRLITRKEIKPIIALVILHSQISKLNSVVYG